MAKFIRFFIVSLLIAMFFGINSHAEEAEEITAKIHIECTNTEKGLLTDKDVSTHDGGENLKITFESQIPMGGIYIKYHSAPVPGSLSNGIAFGENGFYHEFIPLNGESEITASFPKADISEISVFSVGDLPKHIQTWQSGNDKTDILLCATHSDDDQLFFAGLLPKYSCIPSVNIQVAYFVNHNDNPARIHELLDGLWHCGIKNYPDISQFPDGYSLNIEDAKENFENSGFTYENILEYQKYLLNRYKPLVVVLHDFQGEYGHGQHMINTASFIEAVENPSENQYIPEKIYVHLYEENPIILDIDTPLEYYGGKSAFNISQEAFMFHKSQHWTWFYGWIYGKNEAITNSQQIQSYNPSLYGLYYSKVGKDVKKDDFLENIQIYAEQFIFSEPEPEPETTPKPESEETEEITEPIYEIETSEDIKEDQSKNSINWIVYLIPIILFSIFEIFFLLKKKR